MTLQRRSFTRSTRRARQWALMPGTNGFIIGITEATKLLFNLISGLETELDFQMHNVTASALRLSLNFQFAASGTVGDRAMLHYGVTWLTDGAGAEEAPNPAADNADWMAHGAVLLVNEATTLNMPRGGQVKLDSDSMRKQRENNSRLVLVVSATVLTSTTVQVFVGGRSLLILP